MTFRIRQIERTAAGREIVRDRDVVGDTLTIGRLADNDLHLPDLAVEPRHAVLHLTGEDRVRAEAVGTLGFVLDGSETRSATLDPKVGGELGFGTYRLTLGRAEDGTALLTVRKGEDAATRSGDLEEKRGFSLQGVVPGKRWVSWTLALAILLAFLAVPIVSNLTWTPDRGVIGDRSWNPGELSLAHHTLSDRCETCHVKPFEPVGDATCRSCHKAVHDHADPARLAAARGNLPLGERALWSVAHAFGHEGPGACRDCHVEHQGPTRMAEPAQQFCADCHSALKDKLPDTRLGNASDFTRLHPQFTATVVTDAMSGKTAELSLDKPLTEDNGLAFAHRLHLDPRGGVARMAMNLGAARGYGANGLQCKDCHRPTEDGVRFQPVRMERDCEGCHSLAYDRVGGIVRRLRHGDVEQLAADLTAARWTPRAYMAARPAGMQVGARRRPGVFGEGGLYQFRYAQPVQQPVQASWPGLSLASALSSKGVCGECHRAATIDDKLGVVPVHQPARYMMRGWFDHAAHRQESCTSCHAAPKSDRAADVLLPGIAQCRTCHVGAAEGASLLPTRAKVPSTCAMCHGFHGVSSGSRRPMPHDTVHDEAPLAGPVSKGPVTKDFNAGDRPGPITTGQ
ncbi:cytochrome c3-like protein [Novosphingobium sp. PhB165]|uniref:cytochrome c3 family protein n=1 Tax=Novosphingobium sp. PhB165 TaxID=2485105 RepID=UPI0010465E7A|nr:cytochrome c3 family protein [Novosphingobium sp. PhB165]TCM19660.1 cytochrome c3-like protein [Novosphingobium sp. PhB165]